MGKQIIITGSTEESVTEAGKSVMFQFRKLGRNVHGFKVQFLKSHWVKVIDICGQQQRLKTPKLERMFTNIEKAFGVTIKR